MLRQIVTSLVIMALVQAQLAWAHSAMGGLRARRVVERQEPMQSSSTGDSERLGVRENLKPQADLRLSPVEATIPWAIVFVDLLVKSIISQALEEETRIEGIFRWLAIGNHHHNFSPVEVGTKCVLALFFLTIWWVFASPDDNAWPAKFPLKSLRCGIIWLVAGSVGILVDLALHGGRYAIDWLQIADWTQPIPPFIFVFNLADVVLYVAWGILLLTFVRVMQIPTPVLSTVDLLETHETPAQGGLPQTLAALRTTGLSL